MTYDNDFLANEAFIRRAAAVAGPFMLKGSFVTRQYFADPSQRTPNDLDWTYLGRLSGVEQAREVFNDWATRVTELPMNDGISFRSFRENAFWRMIDYAMDDDFPTVNTDLQYRIDDGEWQYFALDISFNLPMTVLSMALWYQPAQGAPFTISYTPPLSLQVAWKLHQTLVRPRFKDLFDLLHLVGHPAFTAAAHQETIDSLLDECRADNTNPKRLRYLLAGELAPLFTKAKLPLDTAWEYWRHGRTSEADQLRFYTADYYEVPAENITNAAQIPATLPEFERQLRQAFAQTGFDATLPDPG
jgi:hypothetical protein